MVRLRFCCVKPRITASPRASEVMKFGSPLIASISSAAVSGAGDAAGAVRGSGRDDFTGGVLERGRDVLVEFLAIETPARAGIGR
jgi:hypothetical protein